MEYLQDRITTLHSFTDATPSVSLDRAGIIVPMTEREISGIAAERVLSELSQINPRQVYIPVRGDSSTIKPFQKWVSNFDLPITVIWCNGSTVSELLTAADLGGNGGKGRDLWLAIGISITNTELDYILIHDADARSYSVDLLRKLCWPLDNSFDFSKGYYARVEHDRLYGRLFRLFVAPVIRTLQSNYDSEILDYLASFRYTLAGEIGLTKQVAKSIRAEPTWGFEIGILGDVFTHVGFTGTAQVDLGIHKHDHRPVSGPTGLSEMSKSVSGAIFRLLREHDIEPNFDQLREEYRKTAYAMIQQYEADARFNDLRYESATERTQVDEYSESIQEPRSDDRLPPWDESPIDPIDILEASTRDINRT